MANKRQGKKFCKLNMAAIYTGLRGVLFKTKDLVYRQHKDGSVSFKLTKRKRIIMRRRAKKLKEY